MVKVIGLDFETANAKRVSACAIGLAYWTPTDGDSGDRTFTGYHSLMRPPVGFGEFHPRNVEVHGIRPADVTGAVEFPEIYERVIGPLAARRDGVVISAHNAPFDYSVMRALCDHYGLAFPEHPWVDTLKTAKRVLPGLPNHKLPTVSRALGFGEFNHHDAGEDARITAAIATFHATFADVYTPKVPAAA